MTENTEEKKDNVVPLAPAIRRALVEDQAAQYPGASIAVAMMLQQEGFDHAAIMANGHWIELRIIAKFSETGAMFHTMQSRLVLLPGEQPPEQGSDPGSEPKPSSEAQPEQSKAPIAPKAEGSPAMRALRLLADMQIEPRNHFIEKVSSDDLATMDEELATATTEEIYNLVYDEDNMGVKYPKCDVILNKLTGGE